MIASVKRRFTLGFALLMCVVLGLLSPSSAQGGTYVIENTASLMNLTFANYAMTISPNIPRDQIPVNVRVDSCRVSYGTLTLNGWINNSERGVYAFALNMNSLTILDGSFTIVDGIPADGIVRITGTSGTNTAAISFFDFGGMAFTQNLTMVIETSDLSYSAANPDGVFIIAGGNARPTEVDYLSTLHVVGITTRLGRCMMSMDSGLSGASGPRITDHSVVSISRVRSCSMSQSILCVGTELTVRNGSTLRLAGINVTDACADAATYPPRIMSSLITLSNAALTVSLGSLMQVSAIVAPGSQIITTDTGTWNSNNQVVEQSTVTFQDMQVTRFCDACGSGGFATPDSTSSVFVGVWRDPSGNPITDYVDQGIAASTGGNTMVEVDRTGHIVGTNTCSAATCLPANTASGMANERGGCGCGCNANPRGVDFYGPSCFDKSDPAANYAGCTDPYCLTCTLNAGSCTKCMSAYEFRNGRCVFVYCNVPNCRQCILGNPLFCQLCAVGFTSDGNGKCVQCKAAYCAVCENATTTGCTTCYEGYSKNEAGVCVPNSKICQVPHCTACSPTNNQQCATCADGYGLANGHCVLCSDPDCRSCAADYDRCTACKDGYTITAYGTCSPGGKCLVANCAKCEVGNVNKCAKCIHAYVLNTDNGLCFPRGTCLVPNCVECLTQSPNKCYRCANGFGVDNTGKCVAVGGSCRVANCKYCSTGKPNFCSECNTGYVPSSTGQCINANARCRVYYCLQCLPGTEVQCKRCYTGYGLATDGLCVAYRRTTVTTRSAAEMPTSLLVSVAVLVASLAMFVV